MRADQYVRIDGLNVTVDIAAIRRYTDKVVQQVQQAQRDAIQAEALDAELQAQIDKLEAARILLQIPIRIATEVTAGRYHAVLMSVNHTDFEEGHASDGDPGKLEGKAKIVWAACVVAGLKPTLEYWWADGGMKDGWNIVIHWER